MKFFQFNQNNSGGYFMDLFGAKQVEKVFIEAPDAETANEIAEDNGLFDLPYCKCCGSRFWPSWGDYMKNIPDNIEFYLTSGSNAVIIRSDGTKEVWSKK